MSKGSWALDRNVIAVCVSQSEWMTTGPGQWFRSYGNEKVGIDENGWECAGARWPAINDVADRRK